MTKRMSGARRRSTPAERALQLEVVAIGTEYVREDLRPGDHVLIDWSLRPDFGAIGAVRTPTGGVGFARYVGGSPMGRMVNPSCLLRVPAS